MTSFLDFATDAALLVALSTSLLGFNNAMQYFVFAQWL